MAEKDAAEKILEAHNDVFADIVNGLLFNGQEVLKPEELVDQAPRAAYKADGQIREIERDVAKRWLKQNIRIACIGFENQTDIDRDMPLRVFGYDGAEYRAELSAKNPDGTPKSERYPVVTLVLYFGYKKHWDQPLNLLGCMEVPEEFKPYVHDYAINLFEIAYLTEEQVKLFKSDFGIVADYFVQMRKNRDYHPEPQKMRHVQETLQLLSVMTRDHRYEETYNSAEEGVPENMCEVLDRIVAKGKAEGFALGEARGKALGEACGEARGEARGEEKKARESAKNFYAMGISVEDIAKGVGYAVDTVKQWLGLLPA